MYNTKMQFNKCSSCGKNTLLPTCARCLVKGTEHEKLFEDNSKSLTIKSSVNINSIMNIHKLKIIKNSKKASFKDLGADKPKDKRYTWATLGPEVNIDKSYLKKSNWGIICNKANGIIGVDLDCYKWSPEFGCHKSTEFYNKFGNDYVNKFNTYTQKTPNGGIHLIFKYDKDLHQTESKKDSIFGKGIDIRNGHDDKILSGGYLVGAGSVFKKPDGTIGTYELINDSSIKPIPEDLKKWLLENIYTKQEHIKKTNEKIKNNKVFRAETELIKNVYDFTITEKELDEQILPNLPKNYLDDYTTWLKFTSAMKALNQKSLWVKYSKLANGYNEQKNLEKWHNAIINNDKFPINYYVEHLFKICKKYEYIDFIKYKSVPNDTKKPDKTIYRPKLTTIKDGEDNIKDKPLDLKLDTFNNGIVLKSDTGTGKTTLMKNELYKSDQKFISIVSRVSLGKEQYNTFNQFGIETKFYANDYARSGDSMITTIDSILVCGAILPNINQYTIFIDEFNSVLEYILQADTCLNKSRSKCWQYLIYMLKNCKNFVCVDADISDICFKLLDFINRKYTYIQNDYKHNKGVKAVEILALDSFINLIKKEKKFMVCCDSKKAAEYIWLETGKKAKLLTSKTDKLDDETLDDYEQIIFSPAIIYGLDSSINRPVFCYHKEHTISPTNMIQQIARCRNIKILYFCFQKKKFKSCTYIDKQECINIMKEKQEYSNTEFDILNKDERERQDLFNDIYVDYLYKQDCYNTNKYCHFKLLMQKRGFNVIYYNKKTTKENKEKINDDILKFKLETFNIDDEYIQDFNEKYLNLTRAQLLSVKDLFISDELMNKTFNLKSYFEHGFKHEPLFNKEKEFTKFKDEDFSKEITAEQLGIYIDKEEQYRNMTATEDIKIKKINQTKFKYYMIDKLKCLMQFKEEKRAVLSIDKVNQDEPAKEEQTNNIIKANRVPTEQEAKEYLNAYKNVFNFRGKKMPELKTEYDCEQLLYKIMKQTFTKDIFNDNKKVRSGKSYKYLYSMNYDCDILKMTKKLVNYQRINSINEKVKYNNMDNHYALDELDFIDDD